MLAAARLVAAATDGGPSAMLERLAAVAARGRAMPAGVDVEADHAAARGGAGDGGGGPCGRARPGAPARGGSREAWDVRALGAAVAWDRWATAGPTETDRRG